MADAASFVATRYGARATTPVLLGAGEWSRAYAFTLGSDDVVLRLGAHRDDYEKDRVMERYASDLLPIPHQIEIGNTDEGVFALSRRIHGTLFDELDERDMRGALPAFLATLDTLRALEPGGTGFGVWEPDECGPCPTWADALLALPDDAPGTRVEGWRAALATSVGALTVFDAGHARLAQLVRDLPDARHLVHGDLLYHNVIVSGSAIAAVLDWGNSMYGDFLYDAAWLTYWWPWYPQWSNIDIRGELQGHWRARGDDPDAFVARMHCYELHIGIHGMLYNAFGGYYDHLERNAAQIRALLNAS